jgi:hypothetical protein
MAYRERRVPHVAAPPGPLAQRWRRGIHADFSKGKSRVGRASVLENYGDHPCSDVNGDGGAEKKADEVSVRGDSRDLIFNSAFAYGSPAWQLRP